MWWPNITPPCRHVGLDPVNFRTHLDLFVPYFDILVPQQHELLHDLSKITHLHTICVHDGCVHTQGECALVVHDLGWGGRAWGLKHLLDLLVQVLEVLHVVLVPIIESGRDLLKARHSSTFNIIERTHDVAQTRTNVRHFSIVTQNTKIAHHLLPNSNPPVKAIDGLDEVKHCAPNVLEYLNSVFSHFGGKSERYRC